VRYGPAAGEIVDNKARSVAITTLLHRKPELLIAFEAQHCVTETDDTIGELVGADMGVIVINPPSSRASAWDGNNDTSTVEKDIITVAHATFELED
jgi:hypothetical protein